ncbi:iron ABC transporter substrate-binding protein [Microbacterium sp. CJ88]|uniref:iron ABC transporter substrate-binding protein n=1 Tax=Microbacterium sp. CJ88 TaxID=3445672 RepID=UPI003F65A5DE
MKRRALPLLAVAATAALALAGCSSSAAQPSGSSSPSSLAGASITVYNAQHEELTQAWADAFTKETGVTVTLRNGSDSELANQIVQEGAASPADVLLTENSPAMSLVENAGLFAPVDQSTIDQVPAEYRPSTGAWTGIAARSTVMVYNPSLITEAQLPASLLDLAKPEWKGRWAASPSGADFQAIVSAVLELEGKDATVQWLTGMKDNYAPYKGNSTVMKAVNAGEIPLGVIYHYYWFIDQAGTKEGSANTQLHFVKNQDPGAFVSISGGGVLASSKNQAAAQAFLAFITGKAGQDVLRTGTSFEYTVSSGVDANAALPPLSTLDAPKVDPSKLNSTEVTDLMTAAGLL